LQPYSVSAGVKMYSQRTAGGFSLVELIVVIGIIALLIGLLLPSLRTAREQAKAVQCASQLRQLGTGLVNYINTFRGQYPAWSGWHVAGGDGTGEDDPNPGWTEQLAPYLGAQPMSTLFNCPSFPEDFRINYFLAARYSNLVGRRSMKFSEIKLSAMFVMSGDCTEPSLYPPLFGTAAGMTLDDCDKDDASQRGIAFSNEVGGLNVHKGGNNVLFADSHVALFRKFDATSMTYHPRKMRSYADIAIDP